MLNFIKPGYYKRVSAAIACCCLSASTAFSGQITVNLRLSYEKALMFEPVIATVTVLNRSGRLISFGDEDSTENLDFLVTRDNGVMVQRRKGGSIPAAHVMPGERKAIALDINSLFELNKNAEYRIQAILRTDMGPFSSSAERLVLDKGFALSRLSVGVPGTRDVSTFALEYLKRDRKEFLYLIVRDDKEDVVYGVFNLGRFVRIRPPTLATDESGNAHVLFESLNASVYTAFTPYGVQLFTEIHPRTGDRLLLRQTPDGAVNLSREPAGMSIFR